MKKILKKTKTKMTLDTLGREMRQGFKIVTQKIGSLDTKVNTLDNKMDRGFAGVALRFDAIDRKIDKRVDDLAAMTQREFTALNTKIDDEIGEIKERVEILEKHIPQTHKN